MKEKKTEKKKAVKKTAPAKKSTAPRKVDPEKKSGIVELLEKKGVERRLRALPVKILRVNAKHKIKLCGSEIEIAPGNYVMSANKNITVLDERTYRTIIKLFDA